MSDKYEIQIVDEEFVNNLVESGDADEGYFPLGKFLAKDTAGRIIAVDNSTGNGWSEDFTSEKVARRWLRGEIEVDSWNRKPKKNRRETILDEVIEALAFDGKIENWKDAAAIVEKLKTGKINKTSHA